MLELFKFYSDTGPERCGLILTSGEVIELDNIHENPESGFQIDPADVLRYMDEINGIWHTHPNATSVLSGADRSYMLYWPNCDHFIVGEDGISKYSVQQGVVYNDSKTAR